MPDGGSSVEEDPAAQSHRIGREYAVGGVRDAVSDDAEVDVVGGSGRPRDDDADRRQRYRQDDTTHTNPLDEDRTGLYGRFYAATRDGVHDSVAPERQHRMTA